MTPTSDGHEGLLVPHARPEDIRSFRRQHGLTQVAFGKLFSVSGQAVWYWEAGHRPVPPYMGLALIGLYHVLKERNTR